MAGRANVSRRETRAAQAPPRALDALGGQPAPVAINREGYPEALVEGLWEMRSNPSYSDVTFVCRDGKVAANRVVLALASPWFRQTYPLAPSAQVVFPTVAAEDLTYILQFMYQVRRGFLLLLSFLDQFFFTRVQGSVELPAGRVQAVCDLADLFGVVGLSFPPRDRIPIAPQGPVRAGEERGRNPVWTELAEKVAFTKIAVAQLSTEDYNGGNPGGRECACGSVFATTAARQKEVTR